MDVGLVRFRGELLGLSWIDRSMETGLALFDVVVVVVVVVVVIVLFDTLVTKTFVLPFSLPVFPFERRIGFG